MYHITLILICLTAVSCARRSAVIEYEFSNGLDLIIIPVKNAELISLVALYSIGEGHDPLGKSGTAHLIEHLYMTSAAGKFPARDFDRITADYPKGWNAQTGRDYTVIATVFPENQLDKELNMAAARMKDLEITETDLDREIPRIEKELFNMYRGIPMLASRNLSAEMLFKDQSKRRRGGVIEEITATSPEELRTRLGRYYKPANARIIICGAVESETIARRVEELFSYIEAGETITAETFPVLATNEKSRIVEIAPSHPSAQSYVAVSYRAPRPAEPLYPAFLVMVHGLQVNSRALNPAPNTDPVIYAPLDRPEVVSIVMPAGGLDDPETILGRIMEYVEGIIFKKRGGEEINNAERYYRFVFCREACPDAILARDPYGVAFAAGRKIQMGIDGDSLIRRIKAVTEQELLSAGEYFAPEKGAAAIIKTVD